MTKSEIPDVYTESVLLRGIFKCAAGTVQSDLAFGMSNTWIYSIRGNKGSKNDIFREKKKTA